MSSLIISFVESSNHCILASSFLVLVWFSLWVLELMVILMTSSSSSKTEFACFFYRVFGVGGFTGLIWERVLTILFWVCSQFLFLDISIKIVLALVFSFPRNLVSSNSEFACKSCGHFNFTGPTSPAYCGCPGSLTPGCPGSAREVTKEGLGWPRAPTLGREKRELVKLKRPQLLQMNSEFDET